MKQAFLLLTIFLTFSASAQMSRLFYGNDWNEIEALKDSITTALPDYRFDSVSLSKSGKSQLMYFKNDSGSLLEVDVLKFNQGADKIGTLQVTGSKEALFALYKLYLNPSLTEGSSPVLLVAKLPTGQSMPITLFQNRAKEGKWILANRVAN